MSATLLVLLLCLSGAGAAAPKGKPVKRAPAAANVARRTGQIRVTYVTAERAYLDRGASDGLSVGQTVSFRRGAKAAASCTIEQLAASSAVCRGGRLKPGDSAALATAPASPQRAAARLPPQPSAAVLAAQRARVLAAETPLVASNATRAPGASGAALRLYVEAAHDSWASVSRSDTAFHRESVNLLAAGAPLPGGLRLYADLTAQYWTRRPEGYLSPHRSGAQLLVRELAVSRREFGNQLVFAAGRVWPWRAASLGVFDGAQVGFRSEDGSWELGAFGGAIPRSLNTAVDLSRPVAGAYGAFTLRGEKSWLQQEAHFAWEPDGYASAEVLTRAWLPPLLDGALDVELDLLSPEPGPIVRAARAHLGYRPLEGVWLRTGARFEASRREVLPTVATLGPDVRALHVDLSAGWDVARHLQLSVSGGHAQDLQSSLARTWFGPEVVVPALLWGALTLGAGYQEELGWVGGRSVWLWASARAGSRTHLHLRGSWMSAGPSVERGAWLESEWGLYAAAGYAVTRVWSVRLSALIRAGEELGGQATLAVAGKF